MVFRKNSLTTCSVAAAVPTQIHDTTTADVHSYLTDHEKYDTIHSRWIGCVPVHGCQYNSLSVQNRADDDDEDRDTIQQC